MQIRKRLPLNIDIQKLLQDCDGMQVDNAAIEKYNKRKAYMREYCKKHREKINEQKRASYRRHKAKRLTSGNRWRNANRDKVNAQQRIRQAEYRAAHRDEINAKQRARRAAQKAAKAAQQQPTDKE